jgi:RNA polymerase sigma factor (sigma-70 family)
VPWEFEPLMAEMTRDQERGLVAGVVAGDLQATRAFVSRYGPVIKGVIRRAGVRRDDTEDLVQDVFERLARDGYRRLRLWRGESSLSTYLAIVTRNLVYDTHRPAPLVDGRDLESDGLDPPDPGPPPSWQVYLGELRRLLNRCLDALGERDRALVTLRHLRDHSYNDLSAILRMSVNHVGVALHRVERKLRDCLVRIAPEIFRASGWTEHGG